MLNPSDVYVSGGSNNLLACWTDKVTKYDASSFYNWEQDNLPLHDLDERTTLLWEKFGHPTSAMTGMSFIVSADATSSCNPLYFTTLSACIDALPEVINYPILIEVASFGRLGGLNLSNKSFGPHGAIEIINRNFGYGSPFDLSGNGFHKNYIADDAVETSYGLASAVGPNGGLAVAGLVTNLTASGAPILNYDIFRSHLFTKNEDGSEIYISSGVNRWDDDRYVNPYIFTRRADPWKTSRMTAALESSIDPWDRTASNLGGEQAYFKFEAFDKTPTTEMSTYDVSTLNLIDNTEITWGNSFDGNFASELSVIANAYFNSLDYIKVNNCNGPVYLSNFNVDARHERDRGIEIKNSNVVLRRCAASRANKAGVHIEDSEVTLIKGLTSYRNYELDGTTRTGVPFEKKRLSYDVQSSYGVGLLTINSTLNISSTYNRDSALYLETSALDTYPLWGFLVGSVNPSAYIPNPESENLYCFSRNDIGIHAINSKVFGGRTQIAGINTGVDRRYDANHLYSELNTEAGVKLDNSVLEHSGRLILEGNYKGLEGNNSKVAVDTVTSRYNQSTSFDLKNSELLYNKDLYANVSHGYLLETQQRATSQLVSVENGQDFVCENSVVKPLYTSSMPDIYGMVYTSACFGKEGGSDKLLPSVQLKDGSDADFIHANMRRDPGSNQTSTSHYGLIAEVDEQSTLKMRGSGDYANVILGPPRRSDSVNVAGIYCNNDSTVKIQGPTTIARFGIDILAENNSNIEITPHQTSNDQLMVSAFNLSSGDNHTMVELHSTRACLVANQNSNIFMENLGDVRQLYAAGPYGSSITGPFDFDNSKYSTYTSAGYVQFYPNANLDHADVVDAPTNADGDPIQFQDDDTNSPSKYYLLHPMSNDVTGISTGGMCVRAIGNSLVKASNVHLPATWHNTSGVIYDIDGTAPLPGNNCTRLFIWNIADNSLLKASYLSVSGVHPRDAGVEYYGPSGQWGAVSGAPSGTPDTSSLSVLDYYGQSDDNPFGKSASAENFGAFRLYFSTDPAADFMIASGTNALGGFARQVFAQGYNFSGNLIASSSDDFEASSQYISVLKRNETGNIHSSGFYYASSMVASPQTVKAVLDDSALNTFANAKHNTVGKSGLAKVVQGYYAVSAFGGDSYNDYDYGKGVASLNNFDLKKDN